MEREQARRWAKIALAFALFGLVAVLPNPDGLSVEGQRVLAVFALSIVLWITRAVSFPMVFFLQVFLLVITGVFKQESAFQGMGAPTIFFLLGAIILAMAVQKHGLHKRIALRVLRGFGASPRRFLLGVILIGSFMSMIMPAHGVVALLIPVALGVIRSDALEASAKNFNRSLLLGITYGSSIGSMSALMGGARNPLAISLYYQATGQNVSFISWFVAAFPLALLVTLLAYIVLSRVYPPEAIDMDGLRQYLGTEVEEMGPMSWGEMKVLTILVLAIVLWVTFGNIVGIAVVAMLIVALLGLTGTLEWEDVEDRVPWGVIFLYAGAITISFALIQTQGVEYLTSGILRGLGEDPVVLILVFVILTIFLSEVMSNAAATGVAVPLAISSLLAIGFPAVMGMYTVALPAAVAFMFIIGTPGSAMVYATGYLRVADFLKPGFILNMLGIVMFMTVGLGWWRLIGLW